jgi:hypothetical protein
MQKDMFIEIKYFYNSSESEISNKCCGELTIGIPACSNGLIDPIFKSDQVVMGSELKSTWGSAWESDFGTFRYRKEQFSHFDSWEDLQERIEDRISKIKEQLKEVREGNKMMIDSRPADKRYLLWGTVQQTLM